MPVRDFDLIDRAVAGVIFARFRRVARNLIGIQRESGVLHQTLTDQRHISRVGNLVHVREQEDNQRKAKDTDCDQSLLSKKLFEQKVHKPTSRRAKLTDAIVCGRAENYPNSERPRQRINSKASIGKSYLISEWAIASVSTVT